MPHLLWNPRVHDSVHNSLSNVPVPNYKKSVHPHLVSLLFYILQFDHPIDVWVSQVSSNFQVLSTRLYRPTVCYYIAMMRKLQIH